MPSIRSMFLPEGVQDDENFNVEDFLREADAAVAGSATRQYAMGGNPQEPEADLAPAPAPDPDPVSGDAGDGELGAGDDEPTASPVAEPPQFAPPPDPLASLPPERRASLLALDQIMSTTPGAVDRVYAALKPEPPRPIPTIPDHVDPDSIEAQLWQQNQEILRRMDDERDQRQAAAQQATQQTRLQSAATQAVANFRSRYPDLNADDITAMSTHASQAGLADAFVSRPGIDPVAGFEEALEHVLWTNPSLRARVSGMAPPPAPTPPVTGPPPQNQENKRILHALSTGAVPVAGPPPLRAALETRSDGRFTPESRGTLVDQLAADLRNSGYK